MPGNLRTFLSSANYFTYVWWIKTNDQGWSALSSKQSNNASSRKKQRACCCSFFCLVCSLCCAGSHCPDPGYRPQRPWKRQPVALHITLFVLFFSRCGEGEGGDLSLSKTNPNPPLLIVTHTDTKDTHLFSSVSPQFYSPFCAVFVRKKNIIINRWTQLTETHVIQTRLEKSLTIY